MASDPSNDNILRIHYDELTNNPIKVLEKIVAKSKELYGTSLEIINDPTNKLKHRTYSDQVDLRKKFKNLIEEFKVKDSLG